MERVHLSLMATTKYDTFHLAHIKADDPFLMAFIDGHGKEYLRHGDEMPQVKAEEQTLPPMTGAPALIYRITKGFGKDENEGKFKAGILSSTEIANLYENAKSYWYPRYTEIAAERMNIANLFKRNTGIPMEIKDGKAQIEEFEDIQVIYWYEE